MLIPSFFANAAHSPYSSGISSPRASASSITISAALSAGQQLIRSSAVWAIFSSRSRSAAGLPLPMYDPRHHGGIFLRSIAARVTLVGHPFAPWQILQLHVHMFRILVSVGRDMRNPP